MSDEKAPEVRGDGVGPALGGEGSPCPTVALGGATWKVGWPTQNAKLRYELLVAQHAESELEARRPIYSAAKFAAKEKLLEDALSGGSHRVFGALWYAAANGPDGTVLLLCSLLKEHQPHATLADARLLYGAAARAVRLALAQVIPPFVTLLVETAPVPQDERADRARQLTAALLELAGIPATPPAPTE